MKIVQEFAPADFKLITLQELSYETIVNAASEADYILAGGRLKIDDTILIVATNLKMIQRSGVGLDSLDFVAIKKRNIPVYVNQGVNADSVAEHTLLLMLSCLRNLPTINQNTHKGIWSKQEQGIKTFELKNKTVGLIGMGNIGQRVAKLLQAFGAEVLYYSEFRCTEDIERLLGIENVSIEDLVRESDIISLHCPLNDQTRNIMDAQNLSRMKNGAILVNTARGGLIDEGALYDNLISGHIRAAALDVHVYEPMKADDKLNSLDNIILTPHIGGVTYDSFSQMIEEAMYNIKMFEEGRIDLIEDRRLKL
jgi:D-3-phosphoglycerate dehydrogenase